MGTDVNSLRDSIIMDTELPRYSVLTIYPQLVHRFWDMLRQTIVESVDGFVDIDETYISQIQNMLMLGRLNTFICYDNEKDQVVAVMMHQLARDQVTNVSFATIYGFKLFRPIDVGAWKAFGNIIFDYFRQQGAQQVRLIVSDKRLVSLLKRDGFDTSRTLCILTVGE